MLSDGTGTLWQVLVESALVLGLPYGLEHAEHTERSRRMVNKPLEDADFLPALGAASRNTIAAMMAKVAGSGYTDMTPAFASLIPLLDANGVRATLLAQRSGITKQAVSQLIRELKARGYVEQVADPTDTRAKIVRLTKRGVALRAACAEVRKEMNAAAIKALGKNRIARLRRDLGDLAAVLGQANGKDS
jgi:DNA-binding MarR family transcriptional regulator